MLIKNGIRLLSNLSLVPLLLLSSCFNEASKEKVRFIGLDGKARKVEMRVPDLNLQAIEEQKKMSQSQGGNVNPQVQQVQDMPGNNAQKTSNYQSIVQYPDSMPYQSTKDNNPYNGPYGNPDYGNNYEASKNQESLPSKNNNTPDFEEKMANVKEDESTEINLTKKERVALKEKPAAAIEDESSSVSSAQVFVQVGLFKSKQNADNAIQKHKKFYHDGIVNTVGGSKKSYRALIGPFSDVSKAREIIKKIKNSGSDAIIYNEAR